MSETRKVLAIDYSKRRIGLAIGFRGVIETLPVLVKGEKSAFGVIKNLCQEEKVDQVVVGISEGKSARMSRRFAKRVQDVLKLPVLLIDETLTTYQAKQLRPKEKMVDSVAAALILDKFWRQKGGSSV